MSRIVKYTCADICDAEIRRVLVNDVPWFKGIDVAKALAYSNTKKAIIDHVDDEDKLKFGDLVATIQGNESLPRTVGDDTAKYINESGMYSLILRSNKAESQVFKHWVTSEVLPRIRKHGYYNNNYYYWRNYEMQWSEVNELAKGREDELHYKIVKHVKTKYPDAIAIGGLGEHLQTHHARADAINKGYCSGQSDVTILKGLPNGFQDALAIELKHPSGSGKLSDEKNPSSVIKRNLQH